MEEVIDRFRSEHGAGVIEVLLTEIDIQTQSMFEATPMDEWLSMIRENQEFKDPHVWVQSITLEMPETIETESSGLTEQVLSVMGNWDTQEWKEIVSDVYQHSRSSRFMDKLTEDEYKDIEQNARAFIHRELTVKE
jgi:predicted small metal-binding protein